MESCWDMWIKFFKSDSSYFCDGASANRKLFKMHFHLTFDDDINPDVDVTYRTRVYIVCEKNDSILLYLMYDMY